MMSDFEAHLSAADSAVTEHLGTPNCSYKGTAGEVLSMHMIIDKDVQVLKEDGYTTVRQTHASFKKLAFVMHSDDVIHANEETYRVVEPLSDDGHMVTVSLIRRLFN